jgi:polysaccharide export outer membrane protein
MIRQLWCSRRLARAAAAVLAAAAVCVVTSATARAQDVASVPEADAAGKLNAAPAVGTPAGGATNIEAAIINDANDYRIGPEDLLDISVWKNAELSRTVPVRPDGKVSLPLVNDIQAAGLTPTQLREQLTRRLAEFIPAPEVAVIVREVHSVKVAVVGSVKTPGRYELKSAATVLECIALAQGLTDFANRDRIVILRQVNGERQRIPFNYRKVAGGDEQGNFLVQPGDIIFVP